MRRLRGDESGFTLIELLMAIVIMGIITLPLGNFALAYFKNFQTTEDRLSDSHDIQIVTAYFSQDVASTGLYASTTPYGPLQSIWTTSFPAGYCGQALGGTPKLLLGWYTPAAVVSGGPTPTASVAYIVEGVAAPLTLHRVYCTASGGNTPVSDATVVHNLVSAAPTCLTAGGATTSCDVGTPPPKIRLTLRISTGTTDSAAPAQPVTLDGQRRQS
jgi:prepilin-type N-terminal cleavage/methylation domain-containing protein